MSPTIDQFYAQLKKEITAERLQRLSVDIIDLYRERDGRALKGFAARLGLDVGGQGSAALFARIIQQYHPDKIAAIRQNIENHYAGGDLDALRRMHQAYVAEEAPRPVVDDEFEYDEESVYEDDERLDDDDLDDGEFGEGDEEDLGVYEQHGDDLDDDLDLAVPGGKREAGLDDEDDEGFGEARGFIEAINDMVFGSLDFNVTEDDLHELEGDLELADFDIDELSGIEHCVHVTSLNLSCNLIVNIAPLARLTGLHSLFLGDNEIDVITALASLSELRELDLSNNNIEDFAPLLALKNLVYVNVMGNPFSSLAALDTLAKRGVMIIR